MQVRRTTAIAAAVTAALLTSGRAAGPAWGWRGDGSGSFPEAQPPTRWGPDTNVVWKTPMPAPSNASPIIVGDRIFVCYDRSGLACIDKADGKVLWKRTNEEKDVLSADALAGLEKRRAEWRRLDGERNQLRKQMRELTQRTQLSTKAGRERHTEGLRKRWERSAAQARRQGKPVTPFKAPDYGPLPTPEEVAKWREQQRLLRTRQAELDRQLAALQDAAPVRIHNVTGYSTPTPVSDGRYVYALFASGVVVSCDLEGNRRWAVYLGPSSDGYGQSASPLLLGDVLLIHLNGLKALEKNTGKLLWTLPARNRYGSPVRVRLVLREESPPEASPPVLKAFFLFHALHAQLGEGKGLQARFGNGAFTRFADSEGARLDPFDGFVDLLDRFRFILKEREGQGLIEYLGSDFRPFGRKSAEVSVPGAYAVEGVVLEMFEGAGQLGATFQKNFLEHEEIFPTEPFPFHGVPSRCFLRKKALYGRRSTSSPPDSQAVKNNTRKSFRNPGFEILVSNPDSEILISNS